MTMALPGQEAIHAVTGDRIRYLEVSEENFRVLLIRGPGNFSLGEHYHTLQTESFEVLSGQARYIAGGQEGVIKAGEKVSFPPRTPHINPWNDGEDELQIIQSLSPALDFDVFHLNIIRSAAKGYIRRDGSTKLLAQAVALHETKSKVYTTKLPEAVQRVLFAVLAPIGRLLGYRYPES